VIESWRRALKEQRARAGHFFKLLGFAYLTLLVLLALDGRTRRPHFGKHTAGRRSGVIDPKVTQAPTASPSLCRTLSKTEYQG